MYTIFSAVLHVRQQSKSDDMAFLVLSARSAVYYQIGSPLKLQ
jgi:hypothetical protein